jgi:hypothetical protein
MLTISAQDNVFSVYLNGRFIHSFVDGLLTDGDYAGPYALIEGEDQTAIIDFSVADRRVDNFILDMGSRGTQLAGSLIGSKRLVVLDSPGGGIRMARRRIAGPADYDMADWAASSSDNAQDGELRTMVRVEGIEVVEVADYATMKEEGFLFAMADAPESNDVWEVEQEAGDLLDDIKVAAESMSIMGPCDPRMEPNDVVVVDLPDGAETLIIEQVTITIDMSRENDAQFDATAEARRALE